MIDGPLMLSPSDGDVSSVMSGFCVRRTAVTRGAGWRGNRNASAQTTAAVLTRRSSLEDALRHPHVNAVIRLVHELRDRHVAGEADELIRLMLAHLPCDGNEVHHLLN